MVLDEDGSNDGAHQRKLAEVGGGGLLVDNVVGEDALVIGSVRHLALGEKVGDAAEAPDPGGRLVLA